MDRPRRKPRKRPRTELGESVPEELSEVLELLGRGVARVLPDDCTFTLVMLRPDGYWHALGNMEPRDAARFHRLAADQFDKDFPTDDRLTPD